MTTQNDMVGYLKADHVSRGSPFQPGHQARRGPPGTGVRAARQRLHSLGLPLGFLEAGDGFGFVVVDVEDGVELGNLQKVMNLFGKLQELQLSSLV